MRAKRMKKIKLKIGDVAKQLGIKKSIIRQWEQEFELKTHDTSQEHNRYYSAEDLTVLSTIKNLLRTQGLSISDAKKQLKTIPAVKYVEKELVQEIAANPIAITSADLASSTTQATTGLIETQPTIEHSQEPKVETLALVQELQEQTCSIHIHVEEKQENNQEESVVELSLHNEPSLDQKIEETSAKLETIEFNSLHNNTAFYEKLQEIKNHLLRIKELLS